VGFSFSIKCNTPFWLIRLPSKLMPNSPTKSAIVFRQVNLSLIQFFPIAAQANNKAKNLLGFAKNV
jgi:hypothetical protein